MPFQTIRQTSNADFPTRWGHFRILGFEGVRAGLESSGPNAPGQTIESAVALVMGNVTGDVTGNVTGDPEKMGKVGDNLSGNLENTPGASPLVRIHSQCLTGDVFGSLRCDCRAQLELALKKIAEEKAGILLYEQQEGRGIGLTAKLRAYELQDHGLDTVEANLQLGYKPDYREFDLPAGILKLLGIGSVRLITNNPEKVEALESAGIRVVQRISAAVDPEKSFERYLRVKREKLGHILDRI